MLFNNADGNYEASYKSNAVLYSSADDGSNIVWIPPAIYKSSCTIDVTFFPFDEQICEMRFGSWTFDATQVRLVREKPMANLDDYLTSGTWDVIEAPTETVNSTVDGTERMELIYKFRIRRKTLFYTVNLIIPPVLISFLSLFVFYLPTDEGEKMTLCISILLALVVFLLLVSKILPPTSVVIPLISKYLLFTFIMNIVTILNTVIIINWNYRTPRTHNMPAWVRLVFIEFLPKILLIQRPKLEENNALFENFKTSSLLQDVTSVDESSKTKGKGFFQNMNDYHVSRNCMNNNNNKNSSNKGNASMGEYQNYRSRSLHKKQLQHELLSSANTLRLFRNHSSGANQRFNRSLSRSREIVFRNRNYVPSADDAIDVTLRKRYNNTNNTNKQESNGMDENGAMNISDEFSPEILEAADKVVYITNHIKSENDYQEV